MIGCSHESFRNFDSFFSNPGLLYEGIRKQAALKVRQPSLERACMVGEGWRGHTAATGGSTSH